MVTLTIDGKTVEVTEGSTVLEAAENLSIWIPTLCHHRDLGSYQACRLCTVEEVQGDRSRFHASCALRAREGMVISTDSERIVRGRKVLMQLILARSPEAEAVRDLAARLGVTDTPFPPKHDDCLLCGLCVRTCAEIMGVGAIGFSGRGADRAVSTPFSEMPDTCKACGACTYICPTNRMQMEAEQVEHFRKSAGWARQCRYVRMGFFAAKVCHNHFQCWQCEVDQRMQDRYGPHPALTSRPGQAGETVDAGGFQVDPQLHYHPGHTWLLPCGEMAKVGLDDFAALALQDLTALDLPEPGVHRDQGETIATARAGARSVDLAMPLSGTVMEVNPDLLESPKLAVQAPYTLGWLFLVTPDNLRADQTRLFYGYSASLWMAREREQLLGFLEEVSLPTDLPEVLAGQWQAFAETFFSAT